MEKQKNYTNSVTRFNTKPSFIGGHSRHSVILGQPGPFGDAKQALDLGAFSCILDVSRINPATITSLNKGNDPLQIDSYDFGMDLALALIRRHVQRRPSIGLQFDVQLKMKLVLGEQQFRIGESNGITTLTPGQFSAKSATRKRCRICSKNEVGHGQKKIKRDMNKSRNQCQTYGHPSCMHHCVQICNICSEQCRDNFQSVQ